MFLQLSQCQDKMHEMEQQLEDPTQLERIRFLAGEDPTPAQLQGKLEQVLAIIKHRRLNWIHSNTTWNLVTAQASACLVNCL